MRAAHRKTFYHPARLRSALPSPSASNSSNLTSADIPTLYEDDDLISLNKPEGLCSIPERQDKKNDLLSLLSIKLGLRPYVVHRLDRDVSGIILFAKNAAAHASLNDQFSGRTIKKTYAALVHGKMEKDSGKIQKPI